MDVNASQTQQQQQPQQPQQPQQSNQQQQQSQQQQQQQQRQQSSNGQIAVNGNPINNNSNARNGENNVNRNNTGFINDGTSLVPATKNQLEQLNTMREAIYAQDGWGCEHVNQNTNWDVPGCGDSPDKNDSSNSPSWRPVVNNGTELWEANLRNDGQSSTQKAQTTSWSHTPRSNLGGVWGEDDEVEDFENTNATWAVTPKVDVRQSSVDVRNIDPRDMHPSSGDPRDPRDLRMVDPRDSMKDIRGDPRGISGRLNGQSEMWGQPPIHSLPPQNPISANKMMGPTTPIAGMMAVPNPEVQWGSKPPPIVGPKDIPNKTSGWGEMSPPPQRRSVPSYDDGTSLWGQQQSHVPGMSQWKEIPDMPPNHLMRGAINNQVEVVGDITGNPPMIPQGHHRSNAQMKPDNNMWIQQEVVNRNNGTWNERQHSGATNWEEKNLSKVGNMGGRMPWNESSMLSGWNKGQADMSAGVQAWPDDEPNTDWNTHEMNQQQAKACISSEAVRNSGNFRILLSMGVKKEEIEPILRATNMNLEDAINLLVKTGNDILRRRDDPKVTSFEHSNAFLGRFPSPQTQPNVPFPPNNNSNLVNRFGSGNINRNPNVAAINSMQPPQQMQKFVNQTPHNVSSGQSIPLTGGAPPSAQQLRTIVQQIQNAVQNGYLSNQILNQPLAPATLLLLNNLLNNIKNLQAAQTSLARNPSNTMQLSVIIKKLKVKVSNLQNQINIVQALYVKQQQQQQHQQQPQQQQQQQQQQQFQLQQTQHRPRHQTPALPLQGGGAVNPDYYRNASDLMTAMQGNFSEMSLGRDQTGTFQGASDQQLRLNNQWKNNTDFSRVPNSNTNNMGLLGLQNEGATNWSFPQNIGDDWPSSNNEMEPKDWSVSQPSTPSFADLVPEFEPGKPWKGSQIKSIEDDPSITPGSVARNPLSLISTPKEADIFTSNMKKTSPTDLMQSSFNSSAWNIKSSSTNKNNSFTPWSEQNTAPTDLWSFITTSREQGPELKVPESITSSWLLLKNLTPQIDGQTIRTLCKQHGPLHSFNSYLNQGIVLCKYSTFEEANKAQMALHNCVLGNVTISAELTNEIEVQNILQHLPSSIGQSHNSGAGNSTTDIMGGGGSGVVVSGNNGGGNGATTTGNTQSTWLPQTEQNQSSPNIDSDTWGAIRGIWNTSMDDATECDIPSNLKSFLPENLLESN